MNALPIDHYRVLQVDPAANPLVIQAAYRDGGLGAPLATCTIVDPVTASFIGIVLLGEHLRLGVAGGAVGFAGLIATVIGLTVLARTHHEPKTPAPVT